MYERQAKISLIRAIGRRLGRYTERCGYQDDTSQRSAQVMNEPSFTAVYLSCQPRLLCHIYMVYQVQLMIDMG